MDTIVNIGKFGKFIVDDDVDIHELMRDTLKANGIDAEFEITDDPEYFFSLFDSSIFNICVLDHILNSSDTGLDVLKKVKQANKWSWVIVMTGQEDKKVVEKYLNAGANKYIDKNWTEGEIKEIIGLQSPRHPNYLDALVHFLKEAFREAKERVEIVRFYESLKIRK